MFDFLRNFGRSSEEEKQQETLSAYLDNELASADRDRVDQQLAQSSDLRDELAEMKLWQAQMRNLPTRRVPRNFTLDPAIYGRPQRQPFAAAYPVLRTATAVTAFLFVIALAASLYMGGITGETSPQPASTAMQEMAPAADEAVPAVGALDEMEMAVEATPETFMLEQSVDKEADEVPVEIVETEVEEAAVESVEEEVLSEAAEVVEGDELLSEKPDLSPSLELEIVAETAPPPMARESDAAPAAAPPALDADMLQAEEAPQQEAVPDLAETQAPLPAEGQNLLQPAAAADADPEASFPISSALGTVAIGLGLLFVVLTILTLLSRGRR